MLDKVSPLLASLLHQLYELLLLFWSPPLPRLGHESAVSAVAHLLSPTLHVQMDLFPRDPPFANQLQQLFIFLRTPHLLLLLVAGSQKLVSGEFQASLVRKWDANIVVGGDVGVGVGSWRVKCGLTGEGDVVEGGKGGVGEQEVVKLRHASKRLYR